MDDEINVLVQTRTWEFADLPIGKYTVGCKWVYKTKHKVDGSIERFKARLAAKGFIQQEGIDFRETCSPVAKITTVRLLLAIATTKNWLLEQLGVNNAFLHEYLNEEVYIVVPKGVDPPKPGQVCKLRKSFYGLRQASRQWYEKLSTVLTSSSYTQSQSDFSLSTKQSATGAFTTILVYVDDMILTRNDSQEIALVKSQLYHLFKIKDLGQLKFFLGLEVARSRKGIFLNQRKYTLELLDATGLLGCKPSNISMDPQIKLHFKESTLLEDISMYRRLIGQLIYLTNTRPDIYFVVNHLSQFLSAPTIAHYQAAPRVLSYLKTNPGWNSSFLVILLYN